MEKTEYKRIENPFKDYDAVKLECPRCKHQWRFAGKKLKNLEKYPVYAQCPNCKTSVKVQSKKDENRKIKEEIKTVEKKCIFCKRIIIKDYLKWLEDNSEEEYLLCPYCDYMEKI